MTSACVQRRACILIGRAAISGAPINYMDLLLPQVGELEKREVKASEELDGLRSEVGFAFSYS